MKTLILRTIQSILLLFSSTCYGQPDSLYNPFPENTTNLPYYATMCGDGEPHRLSEKESTIALDQVFIDEGLEIVKNKFFQRNQSKYQATTYNKKYNIGYIWLEWNLGDGMIKTHSPKWWGAPEKSFSEIQKDVYADIQNDYLSFTKNPGIFFRRYENLKPRLAPTISRLKSSNQKKAFFKKQLIDYKLQILLHRIKKFDKGKNSIPKQWAFNPPKGIRPIQHLAILGLYWKTTQFSINPQTQAAIYQELQSIMHYRHRRKWLKRSKKLLNFLNHSNLNHHKANKAYRAAFTAALNDRWRRRKLDSLHSISDFLTLSFFELGQIDKDNADGTLFIAPISYRDDRATLPANVVYLPKPIISIDTLDTITQQELGKMANVSTVEKEKIYTKLYGKDKPIMSGTEMAKRFQKHHAMLKENTLKKLKDDLRMYIHWAKAQQKG